MKKLFFIIPLLLMTFFIGYFSREGFSLPKKTTESVKSVKTEKTEKSEEEIKTEKVNKLRAATLIAITNYTDQITPLLNEQKEILNKMTELSLTVTQNPAYTQTDQYKQEVMAIVEQLDSLALKLKSVDAGDNLGVQHAHEYMLMAAKDLDPMAATWEGFMFSGGKESDMNVYLNNQHQVKWDIDESMKIIKELAKSIGLDMDQL
ncbi:hypothetical protein [Neobacillus drentensis]|uniref:hypothetical protein n=1 Tax=Neobacillus drentensis TaxID=220684 RepID=UPI0030009A3A